ncbi:hypothetical protein ACFQ1S_12665 [Kibdelosporangium lantanae]|uniref:SnoaL-like domain-containing protein n=1 Tax=Kibdelosporangium lantanae TaxID=1497396 RepID=A0ABW3MBL0_9PSEU
MITGNSEVEEFFETRRAAQQSKDIDRLMRHYSPGTGYYDAISPLLFRGTDEVRRTFIRWFDGYDGPIRLKRTNAPS